MEWQFGDDVLEAETVGEAIVALLGEAEGGEWSVGPGGLSPWSPRAAR